MNPTDQVDLSGQTALVTGAASGIGRASALAFAALVVALAIQVLSRRRGGGE